MNNGEINKNQAAPSSNEWNSLFEAGKEIQEQKEHAKEFTGRELKRLAEITGRTPDDEGVIALNLALRYRKYQQAKALVEKNKQDNENSRTKTIIQHGTMEDVATLKRELEEAMYLYDGQFSEMDETQKRKEAKDSYIQHERLENGENHNEPGYWLKVYQARKARKEGYDGANSEHHAGYDEKRDTAAENLADKLDDITRGVENSEIFKTYEWNKGDFPEENMRDRRDGLKGAGKNGLLIDGRYDDIDWTLYPHKPAELKDDDKDGLKNPEDDDTEYEDDDLEEDDDDLEKDDNPEGDDDGSEDDDSPEDDPENTDETDIEIKLKNIEQDFDDIDKDRIKELENKLDKMLPGLAELYARNRRLLVGEKNRAEFIKVQGEYGELLDEYLRLKAKETYEAGKHEIADRLEARLAELTSEIGQKLTDFVDEESENGAKTQEEVNAEKQKLIEEAEKKLRAEYGEMVDALKTKISADFIDDFVAQECKIESATIDALDNGTLCRKFVSKVLNNKLLKGVLVGAAVAGLAVTGVGLAAGLAAGTMTIGFGFTAGGVAAGAAKGALGGTLMSRQSSKNSAVRGFASEEEIRKSLEGIDITDKNSDISNVTDYLMGQYNKAKDTDQKSNRKKTLVSAGIGAIIGGVMSGVQINNVETTTTSHDKIVGYEPTTTEVDITNFDQVDIPEGHGQWEVFRQLGGDPSNYKAWEKIVTGLDPKYGLVPGSNGSTAGINGLVGNFAHTYPGPISTWPETVQSLMREAAETAVKDGIIDGSIIQTGGAPIYNTITNTVTSMVSNAFMNFLARATAATGIGAIGGAIGSRGGNPENTPVESEPVSGEPTGGGSAPTTPEAPTATAGEPASPESPTVTETPPASEPQPDLAEIDRNIDKQLAFMEQVYNDLGALIGGDGVNIVSERDIYLSDMDDFNNRAEEWWNTLSDEAKEAVRSFERSINDPSNGAPLRNWLTSKGEL